SLPEELQRRLDERIGMGIVGDLARYTQFQTGQSIPAAATAGGAAGAGLGVGAGIAMGQAMGQAMAQTAGPPPAAAPAAAPTAAPPAPAQPGRAQSPAAGTPPTMIICEQCHSGLERPSKFCPECGARLE